MSAITERKIKNVMYELTKHSSCAREAREGWYTKDCRELKLKAKCSRCCVLVKTEKMLLAGLAPRETGSQ